MNLSLKAKTRDGFYQLKDSTIIYGGLKFDSVNLQSAKIEVNNKRKSYVVALCNSKLTMTTPKQKYICAGEIIGVTKGAITSNIAVRFDDGSMIVALADLFISGEEENITEAMIDSISYASVRAKSVKINDKNFSLDDGWAFCVAEEYDWLVSDSLKLLDQVIERGGDISDKILSKLVSLSKRNNSLSEKVNAELKELIGSY